MAFWNRKKKVETVDMPPELQSYYQAESREKTWKAWVLGLLTLIVTILLALALFFGARWIYRELTNKDEAPVKTTQTEQPAGQPAPATPAAPATPTTPSTPESGTSQSGAPSSSTAATGTSTSNNTGAATASNGNTNLTNTGPTNTLAIFAAVTVLAYMLHRRYLLDR